MEKAIKDDLKLSTHEVGILMNAVNRKQDGTARTFEILKLTDVAAISRKIKELFDTFGTQEGDNLGPRLKEDPKGELSYPMGLATSEKTLILECLSDREWTAVDANAVLTLQEKLN